MCNENTPTTALVPVLDRPFHKLEEFFTKHHKGGAAFLHVNGNEGCVNIGPFTITVTAKKVGNYDDLHVEIRFKVGPIDKLIYQFDIKLPAIHGKEASVCHSFNVIGIVKATLCFLLRDNCIWIQYDIETIFQHWKGEMKVLCF